MDIKAGKLKEKYEQSFDPKEYLKFLLMAASEDNFYLCCLYEYFSSEKFTGNRLLELGSGPTVHNVATASSHFSEITLSDLLERNCEALKKWLSKDSDCMDWTPLLKNVAKAEKRSDVDTASQEIEKRIRSSVKTVIRCDLLDDQVIDKEYSNMPFDAVLTAFTLQSAAIDSDSHSKILGRINRLLKKGGKLIMMGTIKCSFYEVGGNRFHSFSLTEDDLQNNLEINGFGDIKRKFSDTFIPNGPFDGDKKYFVTSIKL